MNDEKGPEGQDETAAVAVENLLTYADLLQLEWALEDKIADWEWRDADGFDGSIEKGRATLNRVREMIRLDEEGGRS